MKLKKFRVRNYKSIVDSGDCYPSETVTVFAGKNESGKSSLLEALRDSNTNTPMNPRSISIERPDAIPQVALWFDVPKQDLQSILDSLEIDIGVPLAEFTEIELNIATYITPHT